MFFGYDNLLLRVGAADGRTIAVTTGDNLSGADALKPGYLFRMLSVIRAPYLTFVGSGSAQQPFVFQTGYHVLERSVAKFVTDFGIKRLKSGRQNYGPDIYFNLLGRLIKIYGVVLTYSLTKTAFLVLKVETGFRVDIGIKRDCLSEVDMNGFVVRNTLIKLVRVFGRTVFYTGSATPAFIFNDVSGLSNQCDIEVSCHALYPINFSITHQLYIGMPVDLDQFG
jgi:hypothetical protein